MALTLTEDQLILKEAARSFLQQNSPVSRMRELRDAEDEIGWAGIVIPEEYGGAGMAYGELGVVLEECGRVLAPGDATFHRDRYPSLRGS